MAEMKQNGGAIHRRETPAQENATRKTCVLRSRGKNIARNKFPLRTDFRMVFKILYVTQENPN